MRMALLVAEGGLLVLCLGALLWVLLVVLLTLPGLWFLLCEAI